MKRILYFLMVVFLTAYSFQVKAQHPSLNIGNNKFKSVESAFHLALGDIYGNIRPYPIAIDDTIKPTLLAGAHYKDPWTRDASINTWNGAGLFFPEATKNSLKAVLVRNDDDIFVTGDYWDKTIFGLGVWNHFLYNGDTSFLRLAYQAEKNTMLQMEKQEFTDSLGLFRGAAVYGDGISAYPDIYTLAAQKSTYTYISNIKLWGPENPEMAAPKGNGLVMHALSTNAVYYQAYQLLDRMEKVLGTQSENQWQTKAENLKKAINKHFWDPAKETYRYLVDPFGGSDHQEGMGLAFVLLFEIADAEKAARVFENVHTEPGGIPCIYPVFERYHPNPDQYGRHSGTIWPQVQGFWASAAAKHQQKKYFNHEFLVLTKYANRDFMFMEIYHPQTGLPYGGLQERSSKQWRQWNEVQRKVYLDTVSGNPHPVVETTSQPRTTWAATAYLRMIMQDIVGMNFKPDGIEFKPFVPLEFETISLNNISYRNMILNITIHGKGSRVESFRVNGEVRDKFVLDNALQGNQNVEITLAQQ